MPTTFKLFRWSLSTHLHWSLEISTRILTRIPMRIPLLLVYAEIMLFSVNYASYHQNYTVFIPSAQSSHARINTKKRIVKRDGIHPSIHPSTKKIRVRISPYACFFLTCSFFSRISYTITFFSTLVLSTFGD